MKAEHQAALKYIFQEEVYLLPGEKAIAQAAIPEPVTTETPAMEIMPVITQHEEKAEQPIVQAAAPVTEKIAPAIVPTSPTTGIIYLGANKKSFLIITHYPNHDFMDREHLSALQNILKRKDVELDDVAILNLAKSSVDKWADIYRFFTAKKVLILGKNAVPVGLKAPEINQLKVAPTASLLYSFSFEEMMSSTDNKKAFWDQMKNL